MGALTLKSFPFELRGWDIEKYEGIDPTDGFGSNTRIYVNKNQVVQIEPDYNTHTFNTWLTDKGRQFFDGIFGAWNPKQKDKNQSLINDEPWGEIIKPLIQTIYISRLCQNQQNKNQFLTIIFENLSIEVLNMLIILSENYSFIKLRRAESYKINNNLESNFQLNLTTNKVKLNTSSLCLLVSHNPRYEGYSLNLNLRQRFFKGNFKCLMIGSLIDLTFPISFLGSNLNVLKSIAEGNNIACQEFKFSKNPILIFNNELLKRHDGENTIEMLKIMKYANIFHKTWNGLNMLNSSLNDVGTNYLSKFLPLNLKDLNNFNLVYFLNVSNNKINNLKKIIDLKLLNYLPNKQQNNVKQIFLNQNTKINNNLIFYNNFYTSKEKKFVKCISIFSSIFYENEETFINTEGLIKRTTKLIFNKKTRNNWQILRQIFKNLNRNLIFLNQKENNLIFFNSKKLLEFKNYSNFQYQATQTLTNTNFYLSIKNNNFIITKINSNFKQERLKITNTKLKYWLDDFFSGGKDEYSEHSLVLTNCSKILRSESTNFF